MDTTLRLVVLFYVALLCVALSSLAMFVAFLSGAWITTAVLGVLVLASGLTCNWCIDKIKI